MTEDPSKEIWALVRERWCWSCHHEFDWVGTFTHTRGTRDTFREPRMEIKKFLDKVIHPAESGIIWFFPDNKNLSGPVAQHLKQLVCHNPCDALYMYHENQARWKVICVTAEFGSLPYLQKKLEVLIREFYAFTSFNLLSCKSHELLCVGHNWETPRPSW